MQELSRFIRSRSHYSPTKGRVKDGALLPRFNVEAHRFETSVFFVDELTDEQIWHMGQTYIADPPIKARGDFEKRLAEDNLLSVDFDNTPERHANIVNWPEDKGKQKLAAIKLAQRCRLHLAHA